MATRKKVEYTHPDLGTRLRYAREAAGLSQRALSFDGCTSAYISRIENNERVPSLQIIREFAEKLGVPEEWIAKGDMPLDRWMIHHSHALAVQQARMSAAQKLAEARVEEQEFLLQMLQVIREAVRTERLAELQQELTGLFNFGGEMAEMHTALLTLYRAYAQEVLEFLEQAA